MFWSSLVVVARSASLAIALFDISANSTISQVEKRGHARERVKGWASGFQGGSSSIIEAISIRSSGFLADQQCCPLPSSINSWWSRSVR
jgi:hypothetical protein